MRKIVCVLAVLFMLLWVLPQTTVEAKSYNVTKYNMIIDVKPNGDGVFEERITYDFSGDFNGVYRDIDLDGTDGYEDIKVYIAEGDILKGFTPGVGEGLNQYEISRDNNLISLKVYEKTSNSKKTFVYTYILKNVAEKYKDIGVFNRKVIDNNWDVPLKDVSIEIYIPEGASREDLRVFAHGPLEGYSEIIDNRTFSFYVEDVLPGTFIETLVVFPPDLIADSSKAFHWDELPHILENEQRLANEANMIREKAQADIAREKRLKDIRKMLLPVFLLIMLIVFISFIKLNLRYGRNLKPYFDGDYYRDLPGDYTPAEMTCLLAKNNIGPNDVMATIMDLVRKKRLKITRIDVEQRWGLFTKNKTGEKYMLERLNDADQDDLKRHEGFLMDWFIDELGGGKGLILDDLKQKLKSKKSVLKFQRDYGTFKELAKIEGSTNDFFTRNVLTSSGKFFIEALLLIVLGITSGALLGSWDLGTILILLAIALLINLQVLRLKTKLTRYGVEQRAMWRAFKQFLLHFSNMDRADIPSIVIWEHYLVYAISLGIAKEVLAQLPKVFSETELKDPSLTYMGGYGYGFYSFSHMNSTLNNTIATVTRTVNTASVAASRVSSGSGGGGGFSGGSSGGGGGGGGGGAF